MNINHRDHGHPISGPEGQAARAECRARSIRIRELAHLMSGMGDMLAKLGEQTDAKVLWELGGKYKRMANDPRQLPEIKVLLKAQLAESLPDATPEQIETLYQIGVEAGRQAGLSREKDEEPDVTS